MSKTIVFQSLSGSNEFKEVLSGKKISSNLFTIFYKLKNSKDKKLSIQLSCVAAKKLGNAVRRNRMRRRKQEENNRKRTLEKILHMPQYYKSKFT